MTYKPNTIPSTKHWAIITHERTYVPGDERSRTNPGHGYPEHYVDNIDYRAYTVYEQFVDAVQQLALSGRQFSAIESNPFRVEKKMTITLEN